MIRWCGITDDKELDVSCSRLDLCFTWMWCDKSCWHASYSPIYMHRGQAALTILGGYRAFRGHDCL